MMHQCSSCHGENPVGARFCMDCGARLDAVCAVCRSAVGAEQKFCAECGTALHKSLPVGAEIAAPPAAYTPPHLAQRILASRYALRGEKKQVTVLFCDIVSSTALAATLGAEGMHSLLSEFFRVALHEVHRFEGTVNQFLGDGFMAIFSAPLAHEDHAARAARAALDIRRAVSVRVGLPIPGWSALQLRMGLNSGQVVVGAIGDDLRMDYTASGDTTHLAARLQALAAPGEIICGAATVEAARGLLVTTALAPVLVKGIASPVSHALLQGIADELITTPRRRGRFVGRNDELGVLRTALARAASGAGGVLEIEGEAGVGKSRLIAECFAEPGPAVQVVRGQCVTYGRHAPHAPIVELVRGLCGTSAHDEEHRACTAIQTALGQAGGQVDLLGALLGLPQALANVASLDPATVRGRTIQAILQVIDRLAQDTTLVVVVEDLHWADASSLEFLAALAGHSVKSRCLLVVTFRPGSEPPWRAQWRLQRLLLAPLSLADARQLMQSLDGLGDLPGVEQSEILARAEGNPFFLEELVRAVAQGSHGVPGDVVDVLNARIDRLEPEAKDLLRIAAVIGREFSLDLVEEIADLAERARPQIEQLVVRGFIEPLPGQRRYGFVHALIQEVAYDAMLGDDRKRLHSAVAERLTQRVATAEHVNDLIVRHHLQGLTPAAALQFIDASIERAIGHHALEAAHEFFHHALRLLEAEPADQANLVRRIGLLLRQFPVFHFTHRHAEYAALIERYQPLVDGLGVPALRGPFLAQRGHRLWVAGDYTQALATLHEAVELCEAVGDIASAAHAECMLSWTYGYRGECAVAASHASAALAHLEKCPVPLLQTFSYVGLLLANVYRGRWQDALAAGELARQVGVDAQDDGLASFGGAFWSFAALASGDIGHARELAERAMAEAPTDYFRGWAAAFLAGALTRGGNVMEALPILEQAVALARRSAHFSGYLLIALVLAEARLTAGQIAAARALLEQLRGEAHGYAFVAGGCEQLLGEIALALDQHRGALAYFDAAHALFERAGAEDGCYQTEFGRARALLASGELSAARAAMTNSLAGFRRLGTQGAAERVAGALATLNA